MKLEGKVALISGGARGMGAHEAHLFVSEGAKVVIGDVRSIVKQEVEHFPDLFCVDVHFRMAEKPWRVLAEVVGPQRPTEAQVAAIEKAVTQRSAVPIATTLWFREEAVISPTGYTSFEKFTEASRKERIKQLPRFFKRGE